MKKGVLNISQVQKASGTLGTSKTAAKKKCIYVEIATGGS